MKSRLIRAAIALLTLASFLPAATLAESGTATTRTGGVLSTTARLDVQVVIPEMIYLQVGADPATALGTSSSIEKIDFTVPAAALGTGTAVAAAAASGNRGNGTVTARARGNVGSLNLSASTAGPLINATTGAGSISWSEIKVTAASVGGGAPLPHPLLSNGTTSVSLLPSALGIVTSDAEWTYSYANSNLIAAGRYGDTQTGTGGNNGRITYTLATP